MNPENTARNLDIPASCLGVRDIPSLTPESLYEKYGIIEADVSSLRRLDTPGWG